MKKKIALMLCLLMLALGLTACGIDKDTFDFYGMTYSDCETIMSQNVQQLTAMSTDELAYVGANADDVYIKLFENWIKLVPELGAYQGMGTFSLSEAQDTLTLEQVIIYEKRELCMTFVLAYDYETKQVELVDTGVDLVYTMGEKMEKAALNTLMGMGTVFVVLILISLIIYCFRYISVLSDKMSGREKKQEKQPEKQPEVPQTAEQPGQALTDDLELVAVISAAIAANEGTSTDSFVVRSIHRR